VVELALKDMALAMLGNLGIIGEVTVNGSAPSRAASAAISAVMPVAAWRLSHCLSVRATTIRAGGSTSSRATSRPGA
jgi:hypothetical protein